MSLSVQSLNGDSTFVMTFYSATEGQSFTILVDPWLAGASTIWNSKFQTSVHSNSPLISSLADMQTPDLILISQDKPDHCHEETLKSLPSDSAVHILATPSAAKKIKSWRYFTNAIITPMPTYNPKNPSSVLRFPVKDSKQAQDKTAEVTISYIPQKLDVTSLHNAIGITYAPASLSNTTSYQLPPSPPLTPLSTRAPSQASDNVQPSRPLSILYAPHSISVPCITPYMTSHLAPLRALPLTMLFHCINVERNPWFLGGAVCPGLPAGTALVKNFGARYWLSAHDEPKQNSGWAVAMIKTSLYALDEAQALLDNEAGAGTEMVGLGVGEEIRVEA